jgi:hypothetical protein
MSNLAVKYVEASQNTDVILYIYCGGESNRGGKSKLAVKYVEASQNTDVILYIYIVAVSQIAPLCNKAVSQNLPLNMWRLVKTQT